MFKWLMTHWKSTLDYPCTFHILPTCFDGIRLLDRLPSLKVLLLHIGAEDMAAVIGLRLEASLADLSRGSFESAACSRWQHYLHFIKLMA